ncbi:MAG TPA: hypothetical protein PKE03_03575 [Bacteroidales bacterium]|nr:hypothetical protein [Bacteroidales bacterium]
MLALAQVLAPILLIVSAAIHFGVLIGLLPQQIVWGSRIRNRRQLYNLGIVSLLANLFFLWVVAQASGFADAIISAIWLKLLLWFMTALFALNILGNLSSPSKTEKLIFTPLALLLAASCLVLALHG